MPITLDQLYPFITPYTPTGTGVNASANMTNASANMKNARTSRMNSIENARSNRANEDLQDRQLKQPREIARRKWLEQVGVANRSRDKNQIAALAAQGRELGYAADVLPDGNVEVTDLESGSGPVSPPSAQALPPVQGRSAAPLAGDPLGAPPMRSSAPTTDAPSMSTQPDPPAAAPPASSTQPLPGDPFGTPPAGANPNKLPDVQRPKSDPFDMREPGPTKSMNSSQSSVSPLLQFMKPKDQQRFGGAVSAKEGDPGAPPAASSSADDEAVDKMDQESVNRADARQKNELYRITTNDKGQRVYRYNSANIERAGATQIDQYFEAMASVADEKDVRAIKQAAAAAVASGMPVEEAIKHGQKLLESQLDREYAARRAQMSAEGYARRAVSQVDSKASIDIARGAGEARKDMAKFGVDEARKTLKLAKGLVEDMSGNSKQQIAALIAFAKMSQPGDRLSDLDLKFTTDELGWFNRFVTNASRDIFGEIDPTIVKKIQAAVLAKAKREEANMKQAYAGMIKKRFPGAMQQGYDDHLRSVFGEEDYYHGGTAEQQAEPYSPSEGYEPPLAGDNLGRAPVPGTLEGSTPSKPARPPGPPRSSSRPPATKAAETPAQARVRKLRESVRGK